MKRFMIILIAAVMLLSAGCYRLEWNCSGEPEEPVVQAATPGQNIDATPAAIATDAGETPAATQTEPTATPYHPDLTELPMVYRTYDELEFGTTYAVAFRYDIDFDGKEEQIAFTLDDENWTTRIEIDDQQIVLNDGANLDTMILIDLDPSTPYVNLLVSIDGASADYTTTEIRFIDKKIVTGKVIYDLCDWIPETKQLIFYETSDMLGSKEGWRPYAGENLEPQTDWITLNEQITQKDIHDNWKDLVEYGSLLHCTREVPCEIDGKEDKIHKDSYIYMTRFHEGYDVAEVKTLDGKTALIRFSYTEWPFCINGKNVDQYFDNLRYYD